MSSEISRVLVAYYSLTGHTRQVADAIVAACEADTEAITDVRSREGFFGWWRSGREAWLDRPGEIGAVEKDPGDYDLVILGTPVWAGRVSSPMRAYLTRQGARCKRVALFCTQGGAGAERALRQMAELCGREPVATLVVNERDFKAGDVQDKVVGFVRLLDA